MSWVQLLAVSKSIGSILDRPSPYKMTQQNLLPKFGRKPGEHREERVEPAELGELPEPAAPMQADLGLLKGISVKVEPAAASAPANVVQAESAPAKVNPFTEPASVRRREAVSWWRGWWFGRRRSRRIRREGGQPVQAELMLDCVRVVRNDLTQDDLVVVPRRSGETKPRRGSRSWWARWLSGLRGNRG